MRPDVRIVNRIDGKTNDKTGGKTSASKLGLTVVAKMVDVWQSKTETTAVTV